jgi:essential nuclear protein 1
MPKTSKRRRRIVDPVLGQSSSKTSHDPLGQQILRDEEAAQHAAAHGNKTTANRLSKGDASDDDDYDDEKRAENSAPSSSSNSNVLLDGRSSRRILEMSREQRLEEERVEEIQQRRRRGARQQGAKQEIVSGGRRQKSYGNASSDSDDGGESHDDDNDDNDDDPEQHDDWVRHDDQGYVSVVIDDAAAAGGASTSAVDNAATASAMSKEDLDLIESMMNPSADRRTLADMILDKIDERQKEMQQQHQQSNKSKNNGADNDSPPELPPKVVHVYTEIGKMLSRYTAGKLPKAFKVIPSLSNWQDVLWLTRPDLWTPQAMYAATRIFASNLNPKMAQQFYHLVLLDAVRNDIHFNKKLNYHYYMSLKKSIYKPSSFFKGILLPLVEPDSADPCTLREAIIVASVLQRVSIPVHHAAVAIHKLAQSSSSSKSKDPHDRTTVSYSGPVSIFLRVLLNKKYSLPAPVIDSVVAYFASFLRPTRVLSSDSGGGGGATTGTRITGDGGGSNVLLPVLWHQALLVFVQRYKEEVRTSPQAMQQIKLVLKKHYHAKLTPEIRRELLGGQQAYQEEELQKQKQKGDKEAMAVDEKEDEEEDVEPTLPAPMEL